MQPWNARRSMVESGEVDLQAEHPPHKREQPRVLAPVAFEEDADRPGLGCLTRTTAGSAKSPTTRR